MKNTWRKTLSVLLAQVCLIGTLSVGTAAFASVPRKEEVAYKGAGKVEVEFYGDVEWNAAPKVTVKDAAGKTYKVAILAYDDDDIKFKIKKYTTGKKYTFKISKVREIGTDAYGTVKGTVSIPKKSSKTTSRDKARSIALKHAAKKYKINQSKIYDYDIEKDTYRGKAVWEIGFEARKNGATYSYEYKIQISTGKILYFEQELDD